MGAMPMMPLPMPFSVPGVGATPQGTLSPTEAQQEFSKAVLANQKQMLQQTLDTLAAYQKQVHEAMTAIDEQLSKFAQSETDRKKGSATQSKQSSK